MKTKRRLTLMAALRAEMAYFATLCLMVLAIPLLLPVAQAHAYLSGLVICTQDGVAAERGSIGSPTMLEDCPCVVTCSSCTAGNLIKAVHAILPAAHSALDMSAGWRLAAASVLPEDAASGGSNAIRAPPHNV